MIFIDTVPTVLTIMMEIFYPTDSRCEPVGLQIYRPNRAEFTECYHNSPILTNGYKFERLACDLNMD